MWDLIVSVPDHCLSFYFSYTWVDFSSASHQATCKWYWADGKHLQVHDQHVRSYRGDKCENQSRKVYTYTERAELGHV